MSNPATPAMKARVTTVLLKPVQSPPFFQATAPAAHAVSLALRAAPVKVVGRNLRAAPPPPLHPGVTAPISHIGQLNPVFGKTITSIRPVQTGVTRDKIHVPISPSVNPTDGTLFEDPANASKKFYLPHYSLAVESDGRRFQVRLEQQSGAWTLVAHLTKGPAPASASELNHKVSVILHFTQLIGNQPGAQAELPFQEVSLVNQLLRAVLRFQSLEQATLVVRVLTDRAYNARLIVRKSADIAVPVPQNIRTHPPTGPIVTTHPGSTVVRPPALVQRFPTVPKPKPTKPTKATKPPTPTKKPPPPPPPPRPQPPQFRETNHLIDQIIEPNPFVFSPEIDAYIFAGFTAPTGGNFDLVRFQAPWKDGKSHTYYQDGTRRQRMFYLPDSFKVARRPDNAHEPLISIRFEAAAAIDKLQASFTFIAVPYVDTQRLTAANDVLKAALVDPLPAGVQNLEFEPLLAAPGKARFSLAYPGSQSTAGPFEPRDHALVDLRTGIHDSLTLTLDQVRTVYDSVFSSTSLLMTGKVDLELGKDQGEEIPFSARMSDLAGDILEYSDVPGDAGALAATLQNIIESPVEVRTLSVVLQREHEEFPAKIEGLDLKEPVHIAPKEKLQFSVVAASPIPDGAKVHPAFDLSGVSAIPDSEAIWNAILDATTNESYLTSIAVELTPNIFAPNASDPNKQVVSVVIDFENGSSVQLTAAELKGKVDLPRPLSGYVLRKADSGSYRYKSNVVYASGNQIKDADWRSDTTTILFPELPTPKES